MPEFQGSSLRRADNDLLSAPHIAHRSKFLATHSRGKLFFSPIKKKVAGGEAAPNLPSPLTTCTHKSSWFSSTFAFSFPSPSIL